MHTPTRLQNLVNYTTIAAYTTKEIALSANVPLLNAISVLCPVILEAVQAVKSNKDECLHLVENIHEILCAIIQLYTISATDGQLPPGLLHDIATFTETLQKIYAFMTVQQGMGKIKQFFKQADTVSQLKECTKELYHAVNCFRVQLSLSTVTKVEQMKKDTQELHEELLVLLAEHPELTNSDRTSSAGTFSTFGSSTQSLLLPPRPQIFHGRDTEYRDLVNMLKDDGARIVILGPGGMGKTSLATAVLHHADVTEKYGDQCYFISCHSTATCAELVASIATQIGYNTPKKEKGVVHFFTHSNCSLLVLDNFETPWEHPASRAEVESFLSLLADIPQLSLLVTMRGAERPGKIKWTRPFLAALEPLPDSAALQTFIDIAEDDHPDSSVQELLAVTGNLPLAVTLIANIVAYEGCSNTLARWNAEGTRLLSDGFDKKSSLEVSIMLSVSSSRMTNSAQDLMSILSMLPDGLSDADLVQSGLPIIDILSAKATLMRTSLAFVGNDKRLKLLVPVREYGSRFHPPPNTLKVPIRRYLHQMLELWDSFENMQLSDGMITQIVLNLGNLQSLLSDALYTDSDVLQSVIYLHNFTMATNRPVPPMMFPLMDNMDSWRDHPAYGNLLISLIHGATHFPTLDTELHILIGNKYFQNAATLDQARWYRRVGGHYRVHSNDMFKALEYCHSALALTDDIGCPTILGWNTLCEITDILVMVDDPVNAAVYARRAYDYATHLGYRMGQAAALAKRGRCCLALGDFQTATKYLQNSISLFSSELHGTVAHLKAQDCLAEVHMLKTEYVECRAIHQRIRASIVKPGQPPSLSAIFADLNLAAIDIVIGTGLNVVEEQLHTAWTHLTKTFVAPIGLLFHDMTAAELKLHQGDHQLAKQLFQKTFVAFLNTANEGALFCLERLADHDYGMHDAASSWRWSTVLLAFAWKIKNNLAQMQALRCLGKIFLTHGDSDTALSLFKVALEGLTFMDVHRWRADCMVQMAHIWELRGDSEKSVELQRAARPLFDRTKQTKDVVLIDVKLSAMTRER